ncbi:hypothetical protein [Cupriavidus taiwanensis]|uniref:Uncharacterized protein n=1 Tax=Cupriavidus taiwanensis (strain DSM 17343 / BCRC 17206 / CCUG 44338 / CIP 107171 / LMG 19424 / R1) TaxID=977880 RepID=B3R9M8_CUPTR|nr:hypothetical protein [Cupriavidus taiwanensis]CAQ71603.1 hypothetical protein RALTA_B0992 [Cupriavidus taiwanensis LMG 19424]
MIDLILDRVRQAQQQRTYDTKLTFEANGQVFNLIEPHDKQRQMMALIRDDNVDDPTVIFQKISHTVDGAFWKMATMTSSDTDLHLEGGFWVMCSGILRTRTHLHKELYYAMQKASQAYIETFGVGVSKQ